MEAELQEYEVVNNGTSSAASGGRTADGNDASTATGTNFRTRSSPSNTDWEQYADIIDEADDLK